MNRYLATFSLMSKIAKDITFTPHEHQVRSKQKLDKTDAMLFMHGMGTGKTLSSIYSSAGEANVVVPAALRKNYNNTLEKFDIGDPEKFNVMSYEGASRDGIGNKDTLIVDEIQRIGNSGSGRSKAVLDAAKRHEKRIALSGTPAQNHPYELAPIIRFLSPDAKEIPLDPMEFNRRFISEKKKKPSLFHRVLGITPGVTQSIKNEETIRSAIKGKVDYHASGDESFPDRIDEVKKIEMDKPQSKYYQFVTGRSNPMLALKIKYNLPMSKKESGQLNAFMTAARQVSNTTAPYGGTGYSPKIKAVVDDIKEGTAKDKNFKAVTYSNYISGGLDPIAELLDEAKISYGRFTGSMNDKQKDQVVKDYNEGKIKTLLLSGAGAEGIDLKGTKLMQVVEPHWNKAKVEQVIARGIRSKSHDHLPEKERKVRVIKYQSTLPKSLIQTTLGRDGDTSSDEYLEELSETKAALLGEFLDVFKQEGSK